MINESTMSCFRIRAGFDPNLLMRISHAMDAIAREIAHRGVPEADILRVPIHPTPAKLCETLIGVPAHHQEALFYLHKLKGALDVVKLTPRSEVGTATDGFGRERDFLRVRVNVNDDNINRVMDAVRHSLSIGNVIEGESFRQAQPVGMRR